MEWLFWLAIIVGALIVLPLALWLFSAGILALTLAWPVVLLAGLGWLFLSSPKLDVANWFWGDGPAPWERVDAFFYPDRNNLSSYIEMQGVASVDECRRWVAGQALRINDLSLNRSTYECGVGFIETFGPGLRMYRRTVR